MSASSSSPQTGGYEAGKQAGRKEGAAKTLAQTACLVIGIALVGAGILGFIFGGTSFGAGDPQGDDLIIFEVNGWHNVVHLLTGLLLLAAAPRAPLAIAGLLVFAGGYAIVTIWGFIDGDDVLGLVAIDTADNFLHLALTLVPMGAVMTAALLIVVANQSRGRIRG